MQQNEHKSTTIKELFASLPALIKGRGIADIFIQLNPSKEEISLYDDKDELLQKIIVTTTEDETANSKVKIVVALRKEIKERQSNDFFNKECEVQKPFSIQLVDEEFNFIEELLFLDDDLILASDPLLKDLDEELDDFLKKLLAE